MVPPLNKDSSSPIDPQTHTQQEKATRESSSCDFLFAIHPAHFLLGSSIPLCLGAYAGYRTQLKESAASFKVESKLGGYSKAVDSPAMQKVVAQAPIVAARALVIGSALSIGGVTLLCGVLFYASGYPSVDDAVSGLRIWAPVKRRQFVEWCGLRNYVPPSRRHEDSEAISNMTEEEEMQYLQDKYFSSEDYKTS